MQFFFDYGRAARLTFAALTLAFAATSRFAACCEVFQGR